MDQSSDVAKVYGQPASLGDMLAKLTAEEQTNGPTLINILLLTYHDYSSIKEIMEWLQKRYLASVAESTGNIADSEREAEIQMARRLRIVNFVRVWIQNHFHDFEELGCYDLLNSFIGLLQVTGMSKASENLRSILHRKNEEFRTLRAEMSKQDVIIGAKKDRTASVSSSASGKSWNLLGRKNTSKEDTAYDSPILLWDETELAKQLCLIDFDLMRMIRSRELLGAVWTKQDQRHKKAAGVCALIDHFNRMATWVGTEILSAPEKSRQKVARHFAKVVKELVRLNNYCSSFAITAQLTDSTVSRLNYLTEMSSSSQKSFDQLKALLHPELRPLMRKLVPPYIPYPGMYLNDLALIDEGNASRVEGLINFRKYILMANSIDEFLRCQSTTFPFETKPDIQEYIRQCPVLTSEQLTDLSLRILPLKNDIGGAFSAAIRSNNSNDGDRSGRVPSMSPSSSSISAAVAAATAAAASTSAAAAAAQPTTNNHVASPTPQPFPQAPSSPAPPRSPKPAEEAPPPPPPRQLEDNGSLIRSQIGTEVGTLLAQLKEREEVIGKLQAELEKEREKTKRLMNVLRSAQHALQSGLDP